MSFVAVAVGTGAAIGVGGSIAGGMIQADAAKGGAAVQADAATMAERGLNDRSNRALAFLAPYQAAGTNALTSIADLLVSPQERQRQLAGQRAQLESQIEALKGKFEDRAGIDQLWATAPLLTGKNASERRHTQVQDTIYQGQQQLQDARAALAAFDKQQASVGAIDPATALTDSPAFKFQLGRGTQQIERNLAKSGLLGSTGGQRTLADFTANLTAQDYQSQIANLFGLVNTGANAAGAGASSLANFAAPIANAQMAKGSAEASGIIGAGNATANMISGAANAINGGISTGLQYNQSEKMISALNNRNTGYASIADLDNGGMRIGSRNPMYVNGPQ